MTPRPERCPRSFLRLRQHAWSYREWRHGGDTLQEHCLRCHVWRVVGCIADGLYSDPMRPHEPGCPRGTDYTTHVSSGPLLLRRPRP